LQEAFEAVVGELAQRVSRLRRTPTSWPGCAFYRLVFNLGGLLVARMTRWQGNCVVTYISPCRLSSSSSSLASRCLGECAGRRSATHEF
jgi:hypothetical protein